MKKLFLIALLSLTTLIGYSQVDTIYCNANSPLPQPDSLGFNAKVIVRRPAPNSPTFECGVPNITLESDITPVAIAIYQDTNAIQWLSTQFLFNLPYNDSLRLHFCVAYQEDCYCALDHFYDTNSDGIVCDSIWNSTGNIPNTIVAYAMLSLECTTDPLGVQELSIHKKLIRVIDETGRDAIPTPNGVFIYVYDDGSRERKVIVK